MKDNCRKDYRNRMQRIMKYWEKERPDIYSTGVVDVSKQDQNDPTKYFFKGKFKKDFECEGFQTRWIEWFLVENKTKKDGKNKSWDDLRKYKDAIMWGAKTAGFGLPTPFYQMFNEFLKGYKKEFTAAKKRGNTDDATCDPIPFTLYCLLLTWALMSDNILV